MTTTLAVRPAARLAPAPIAHLTGRPTAPGQVLPLSPGPGGHGIAPGDCHQTALELDFDDRGSTGFVRDDAPSAAPAVVQGILEVLDGRRSAVALQRFVAPDVLARLARASARRRADAGRRGPTILRLRVTTPRDRLAECAAVVVLGDRVQALALRMRRVGTRWVVDAVELG